MSIVTSENKQHPDVVEACAAAGAHVCIEKPMAASLSDAQRMVRACQAGKHYHAGELAPHLVAPGAENQRID